MKEYATMTALKHDFVAGDFLLENEVSVRGNVYRKHTSASSNEPFLKMVTENAKGVVVYSNQENESDWLMFLWGAHKNKIIPYDVRSTTRAIVERDEGDRVIADKVEVHFLNLPISASLVAKVDTGAEMCSLHAQDVQVNRGQGTVSFTAPQLSKSKLNVPLADQQAVKTSGGDTTYRPVIKVSMKIKNKILKDILCNLNDRSEMNDPMLLGQNALHAGKFLVDPNIMKEASELLTPAFMSALQHDQVVPHNVLSDQAAEKLYEALEGVGDISIGDVMKLLRTQVLKKLDDISY